MRERTRTQGGLLLVGFLGLLVSPAVSPVQARSQLGLTSRPLAPASQFHSQTLKAARVPSDARGPAVSGVTATSGRRVSVIVKLEDESVATYMGGVPGLDATSPRATGRARLDARAPASVGYRAHLKAKRDAFEAAARQAIPGGSVLHRFDLVLGGVSMIVPADQLAALSRLPGVKGVYPDVLLHLHTERSPAFIGAPTAWSQLGGQDTAGEGVIVGVLDTGVWPEHPSFADPDPLGKPYAAPPPPAAGARRCEFSGGANPGTAFACNNKLIGADRFMATYDALVGLLPTEFTTARDDDGHGTHTASTAAGNRGVSAAIFDQSLGIVSGIAPRAQVMAYKVCGDQGCFGSDSVAAVQKAIEDGVDVINFSISGGGKPYADGVELAFLDAYAAGVFVAASAGNSGPALETVDHRGPWVTTVGASSTDRQFLSTLTLAATNGDGLTLAGASISGGLATAVPVVFAATLGNPACSAPFAPGSLTGTVVVCERPGSRIAKSFNAVQAGAVGMILYDLMTPGTPQGTFADSHWVPTVHLAAQEGKGLADFAAVHAAGVTASFTAGIASAGQGDRMTSFSSRGGPAQTLGVSKPDVTAPGLQILAGHSPEPATLFGGPPGELFQAIQGTSMSSPHVAGAGALLRALHPTWTPGQIKSALMTTALAQGLVQSDGVTPFTPFDAGSGRIDLNRAGDPGITFDVPMSDYVTLADRLWDANYPSVYVPAMPGVVTVERTARSELGHQSAWRIRVASSPDDVVIGVPKAAVLIPPGGSATFAITVDARAVPLGEVRHAVVELTHGFRAARLPITIVRRQAVIALDKTCAPSTLPLGGSTLCAITMSNPTFGDAVVNMRDRVPSALRLVPGSVSGGATTSGNDVVFTGTLAAATPPDVAIAPGASPAGYLPLSGFGVGSVGGVGDETITNFDVPSFLFGGETYTRIGLVSNGYAVVGGGSGTDVDPNNQTFPSATSPNNVLAPFWTDLNPAAGGALRIGLLTDGVSTWIVLEWDAVREFSSTNTASFQIWIGVNGVEDISYVYDLVHGNGDGGLLTVGAENRFGNRGQNVYVNGTGTLPTGGTELRVTTTPGAVGEARVITFNASGVKAGPWTNCAEMTGEAFTGISTACTSGEVRR